MSFYVTILGSSSAIPSYKRNLAAHLVNHDERLFLIDCGEGTQMQLLRYNLKFHRINHIFISHLHGDHVFGLFGLLATLSMANRKSPLNIYSHYSLEEIVQTHLKLFNYELTFPLIFHKINHKDSQILYDDKKLEVHTIPLKHRIPCVGFLFKEKQKLLTINKELISVFDIPVKEIFNIKSGSDFVTKEGRVIPNNVLTQKSAPPKSYAYCTDTLIQEKNVDLIKDVDLLYHEATFLERDAKLAKNTYHSTAHQAAALAQKANAQKLVIGHFSNRYNNDYDFLVEAKSVFENTILAEDGATIEIS